MLTIIAWLVFIPALAWNFVFILVNIEVLMNEPRRHWWNRHSLLKICISFGALFVPGVYLFGWW